MAWAGNNNPGLVEAIVAAFRDPPERSLRSLARFTARDWKRTEIWLNTSGIGLYLLVHLRSIGISHAIDSCVLSNLECGLEDNRQRTAEMLAEFIALNRAFQGAGMRYTNLKGFTLEPDCCADLSLRRISDLDFLVDPADVATGRRVLEERGYALTFSDERTLEFRKGSPQLVTLDRYYRWNATWSVELHIAAGLRSHAAGTMRDGRLDRLGTWTNGVDSFPALCAVDQLAGQALHLLGHLLREHSRVAWVFEYRNHMLARRDDESFWKKVRELASENGEAAMALGIATLLATDLFGPLSTPELDTWTVDGLPPAIKLWVATYGRRAVLAEVPGTKLYLLLNSVLGSNASPRRNSELTALLLPIHAPQRILRAPSHDTVQLRIRREITQIRFIAYRLAFHLKQGAIYLIETARWKKLMKESGLAPAQAVSADAIQEQL